MATTDLGCANFREHSLGRRSFLQLGLLGTAGLSLADLLRAEDAAAAAGGKPSRVNSVIVLWMRGGPSHIDTWDPKPDAPVEFRGEFGTMATAVPGIQLIDLLPLSAKMMNKWSIIRSLHHRSEDGIADHGSGDQICFTGYGAGPDPGVNINPSCGSIAARELQHLNPELPAYVMIPKIIPGTDSGYFGPAYKPFETGSADPANPGPFKVPMFQLPDGLTVERFSGRKALLGDLDSLRRKAETAASMGTMDKFRAQAWNILSGTAARDAFDLDKEPQAVRDRYGFTPAFDPKDPKRCAAAAWSQRILLARRLVEAGVRLVTVDLGWWDTHVKGFESLKLGFMARFDQAYTALIEDLEQRGMLSSTMVLAWGEFGRTPKVNADAGRDHYPQAMSAAMVGGGIQGGRVIGSTDSKGTAPKDNPKITQDVLATVYRHLGIDKHTVYVGPQGRPQAVLPAGEPIDELF